MTGKPNIDDELLAMLRCPADRTELHRAEESLVCRLNELLAAGELNNVAGDPVEGPLDFGLLREDGRILYPVVDGIPKLLIDEGIPLEQTAEEN